jgi:hypothetical protein
MRKRDWVIGSDLELHIDSDDGRLWVTVRCGNNKTTVPLILEEVNELIVDLQNAQQLMGA